MSCKVCTRCKLEVFKNKFLKDKNRKDGLHPQCKECTKEYQRSEKGKKSKKKADAKYRQKEYVRLAHNKESLAYQKKNKGKVNARTRKYQIGKFNQTPAWANLKAIELFYINCPKDKEVDHIVPLQGKTVSGFHVEYNLQYLTRSENAKKGNKCPQLLST